MYSFNYLGNLTIKLLLKNCSLATALISNHTCNTIMSIYNAKKVLFNQNY